MPRRQISYPLSLVLVVALLVSATGGWISWWNYRSGRASATATAGEQFDRIAAEVGEQTQAFLRRTEVAAQTLVGLAALDPPGIDYPARPSPTRPAIDSEVLARRFAAVLNANHSFSWTSYSNEDGDFVGAWRPAAGLTRFNRSFLHDGGKSNLDEHDVQPDGSLVLHQHKDDSHYDPRTRPFYQIAVAARGPAWTAPYLFLAPDLPNGQPGLRWPGITHSNPVIDRDGHIRGVIDVDFDLHDLASVVQQLHVSDHGKVAILTADNTVVAHPSELVTVVNPDATLPKVSDLADPALRALVAGDSARNSFEVDGTPYVAREQIIKLPGGGVWRVLVYAPESDFIGELNERVQWSLIVSLIGLIIAVLVAWLLAHRVSDPLRTLAGEMAEVGNFRLDGHASRPSMFREIQQMHVALARMKGGLRSFARFVPHDLVRAVLASGRDASLSGEVRPLTVYFSDLAGFTTLAESKAPDELVHFLGEYLDTMSSIIADERGTVDKYLGDGIMAFWGAPLPVANHAVRACAAALRCQAKLAEFAARGTPLHTRIGIATGDVLVGNIGSSERMNYTVMGDTANLASRLESLNKQLGTSIMISEGTFEAARAHIVARPLDVVAVKGKSRGVRVYELLAMTADDNAAAGELAADATAALDAYLARDFATASAAWERILARTPDDGPARVMRDRADALRAAPPGDDWTGVYVAKEK